jgi:hypothetical protein
MTHSMIHMIHICDTPCDTTSVVRFQHVQASSSFHLEPRLRVVENAQTQWPQATGFSASPVSSGLTVVYPQLGSPDISYY